MQQTHVACLAIPCLGGIGSGAYPSENDPSGFSSPRTHFRNTPVVFQASPCADWFRLTLKNTSYFLGSPKPFSTLSRPKYSIRILEMGSMPIESTSNLSAITAMRMIGAQSKPGQNVHNKIVNIGSTEIGREPIVIEKIPKGSGDCSTYQYGWFYDNEENPVSGQSSIKVGKETCSMIRQVEEAHGDTLLGCESVLPG